MTKRPEGSWPPPGEWQRENNVSPAALGCTWVLMACVGLLGIAFTWWAIRGLIR